MNQSMQRKAPSARDLSDVIDFRGDRRTVIPTPRSNRMFSGWGPRF